ncbi:MAG: DUF3137 domain-containing protein [Candidatus Azobacteroides sp.]|nr:DUF3137 domain-containing protein [Candidatus Azobacteroides sp.]
MNEKIEQLQQELYSTLKKAEKNRKKLSFYRFLCYGGAVVYFLGIFVFNGLIFSGNGSPFMHDYSQNPNPTFWEANKLLAVIIPLFVLITAGSIGLGYYYKKFTEAEQTSIKRIIGTMFPDAKCNLLPSYLPTSLLIQSNFFGGIDSQSAGGYSFGTVTFENSNRKMNFRDIVINASVSENWLSQSTIGGLVLLAKVLYKSLFAKRVENIASTFRGMFADAQLEKKIDGTVVVLPDHLESRLDYLAKNIQALKNVNGNKLVMLEDVEFERYFVVYASDEITARYVLTPAMMLRMTELKKKYNRDIMLSFSGDHFYFAVAMPEGFLTLGKSSLTSGEALKDLYDDVVTAREILNDLKLK